MKAFGPALDPRCCCFDGWDIGQIALDKCRSGITVFFYFFSSKGDIVLFAPFVQRVVVSVLVAAQDEHFVYLVEEQLRRDILFRLACAYKTRLHGDLPRPMPAWPPWCVGYYCVDSGSCSVYGQLTVTTATFPSSGGVSSSEKFL